MFSTTNSDVSRELNLFSFLSQSDLETDKNPSVRRISNRPADAVVLKIVVKHSIGFLFIAGTWIFKVAYPFLRFRVDADYRVAFPQRRVTFFLYVLELLVSVFPFSLC